ncbi:hypothetical protein D3C85_1760440 [compost metagenome]
MLETDHPSLIELLVNGFYHDLVMEQVEKDFSEELDREYGKDYERIIQPYREYLNT